MYDGNQEAAEKIPLAEQEYRKQQAERAYQAQAAKVEKAMACRPFTVDELINDLFTYHAPTPEQIAKLQNVREAAKYFAKVIVNNVPGCTDSGNAFNLIRSAVMFANAAIVREGRPSNF